MSFKHSIKQVLQKEGGYSNHPDDTGEETKYGICKKQYPNLDIKNLTIEQAIQIYYTDYWLKYKCFLIPYPMDEDFFDAVVNIGGYGATITLQRAINTLAIRKIQEDGKLGAETESAIRKIDLLHFKDKFKLERVKYYLGITDRNKIQLKFLRGWLHRVLD